MTPCCLKAVGDNALRSIERLGCGRVGEVALLMPRVLREATGGGASGGSVGLWSGARLLA